MPLKDTEPPEIFLYCCISLALLEFSVPSSGPRI